MRFVIALAATALVVLAGWGIFTVASHWGKTRVAIQAIPDDSTITMNGVAIRAGTFYLQPGHYVFKATRRDFGPVEQTLTIKRGTPSKKIYLLPLPDTAAAITFLNSHPEIQRAREQQGGAESEVTQTTLTKRYPITAKLPAYTSDYRIDYSLDENGDISFSITLYAILNNPDQYSQYRQQLATDKAEALQFLRDNHLNPDNYYITYTPNI